MDPHIEALAIRMLTEYDFDANMPPETDVEAVENYKRIVHGASMYKYSKRGIDFYNASLARDEQFISSAACKDYVERACAQMRAWASSR